MHNTNNVFDMEEGESQSVATNDFLEKIQKEIQSGILTNQGKPFTFTVNFITEVRYYKRSKVFPKLWRQKETIRYGNIFTLERTLGKLPSSITAKHQKRLFDELGEGCERWDDSTQVREGYIVTIHVPEAYASEQYKKYAKTALPFRDKLLCNHKDLIKKMITIYSKSGFSVTTRGVDCSFYDKAKLFSSYDMSDLKDIFECYGFALAANEVFRPEWEQYGKYVTKISVEGQSLCVENLFVKEKPTLHSW